MANDILALQTLYGANFTTQSGNTIYSWNPTTGQEFINGVGQPAPGGGAGGSANRIFMTVWDGGGIDTYDLSNYSTGGDDQSQSRRIVDHLDHAARLSRKRALCAGQCLQRLFVQRRCAVLYRQRHRRRRQRYASSATRSRTRLPAAPATTRSPAAAATTSSIGGSGTDTAVFSGNLANYRIGYNAATQTFTVADQRAGTPDGTDTITGVENFQFADGVVASSSFAIRNHAPVVTVPSDVNVSAIAGQSLQVSSLFSATDADNDALTYYFQDNSTAANSGHFVVNGTAMAAGTSLQRQCGATRADGLRGRSRRQLRRSVRAGQRWPGRFQPWPIPRQLRQSRAGLTVPSANVSASARPVAAALEPVQRDRCRQ